MTDNVKKVKLTNRGLIQIADELWSDQATHDIAYHLFSLQIRKHRATNNLGIQLVLLGFAVCVKLSGPLATVVSCWLPEPKTKDTVSTSEPNRSA